MTAGEARRLALAEGMTVHELRVPDRPRTRHTPDWWVSEQGLWLPPSLAPKAEALFPSVFARTLLDLRHGRYCRAVLSVDAFDGRVGGGVLVLPPVRNQWRKFQDGAPFAARYAFGGFTLRKAARGWSVLLNPTGKRPVVLFPARPARLDALKEPPALYLRTRVGRRWTRHARIGPEHRQVFDLCLWAVHRQDGVATPALLDALIEYAQAGHPDAQAVEEVVQVVLNEQNKNS